MCNALNVISVNFLSFSAVFEMTKKCLDRKLRAINENVNSRCSIKSN